MPTMTKLIAAVFFAAVAYFAAEAFRGGLPVNTHFGQFNAICAAIGLFSGWLVMGAATGKGYGASAGAGVRTSVTIVAWALLVFSIILMVRKAFQKRYVSPTDAIVDVFSLALENGVLLFRVEVLSVLLLGGVFGGLLAEWTKARWE
jgi:hypothetical protein